MTLALLFKLLSTSVAKLFANVSMYQKQTNYELIHLVQIKMTLNDLNLLTEKTITYNFILRIN